MMKLCGTEINLQYSISTENKKEKFRVSLQPGSKWRFKHLRNKKAEMQLNKFKGGEENCGILTTGKISKADKKYSFWLKRNYWLFWKNNYKTTYMKLLIIFQNTRCQILSLVYSIFKQNIAAVVILETNRLILLFALWMQSHLYIQWGNCITRECEFSHNLKIWKQSFYLVKSEHVCWPGQ